MRVQVYCEGTSALIMDAFRDDGWGCRYPDPDHIKTRKDWFDKERLEKEATEKLYRREGDSGEIGLPTNMLRACLRHAGMLVVLNGKKRVSTSTKTVLPSLMTVEGEFLPLTYNAERWDPEKAWRTHTIVCRVDRINLPFARPLFTQWGFEPVVTINGELFSEEKVQELFRAAGMRVGVGGFRPVFGGPFGKFAVKSWERVD